MDIKKVLSYIYNSKTSEGETPLVAPVDELQTLKAKLAESEQRNRELMEKLAPQNLGESITTKLQTPPTPVAVPVDPTPVIDPQLLKATPEQLIDGIYKKVQDDMKLYKSPKNLTDVEAFVYVAKQNGIPSSKIAEDIAKGNFDYS